MGLTEKRREIANFAESIGMCKHCFRRETGKFKWCDKCLDTQRKYKKNRYDKWKENNKCLRCGAERMEDKSYCAECLDYQTNYNRSEKQREKKRKHNKAYYEKSRKKIS